MSVTNNSVSAYQAAPEGRQASLWSDKARLRKILMFGGLGLFLIAAAIVYFSGGRFVESDDSYIHANKLMVSTDVSGLIQAVNVHEGQRVKAGQILFTLDPKPFQIALDNAKAALASTVQDVESTRAGYRAALSQIAAQQAQVNVSRSTFNRYQVLAKQNAIAPIQVDTARAAMLSAQATLASLQQTAATLLAKLGGNPNTPAEATPDYQKAKAQVDEMQRQLDHATVRAPFSGVVSEVDSLQPGTLVISALSAFTTTSAVGLIGNDVWIESDLKETELTHIHPGNPVDITVDTYPGHHWKGVVDSVSAGSDSAFSVLPAENGSGNWVKVVQRIPVRIRVEQQAGDPPLRAGMSTLVSIDTGKRRWQRMMNL